MGAAGEVWLGVSAAGAFEAGPLCEGSAVLGVEVWGVVPEGLCVCAGAGPEGDVLSGVVLWATTKLADSSNSESNVALDFIKSDASDIGSFHWSDLRLIFRPWKSSRLPMPPSALPYIENS